MVAFVETFLAENSPGFVLTAAVVCAMTALTVSVLLDRAEKVVGKPRLAWLAFGALVAGFGVWTTHFVAILGFRPDVVFGFAPGLTLVSAVVGVILIGVPLMATALTACRRRKAALGGLAGVGVGAMHFAGMRGLSGCVQAHDATTTGLAFLFGTVAFGAAAALPRAGRRRIAVCGLLAAGVCLLHFTAMEGLTLTPSRREAQWLFDPLMLILLGAIAWGMLCVSAAIAAFASARVDAHDRKAAKILSEQYEVLATALHNMSNGLVMITAGGCIGMHNHRALDLLRVHPADMRAGMTLAAFGAAVGRANAWSAATLEGHLQMVRGWLASRETTRVEHSFKSGRVLLLSCRPLSEGGAILTYDDVTEQRRVQAEMTHMAYHDALTGLPNRRSFREQLGGLLGAGPVAMLMLDLDRFKSINDSLGHAVGDGLLVQATERLRESCRHTDLLFRLGGDELAILPQPMNAQRAEELARRVIAAFAEPFAIDGHTVSVGCSIGLAVSGRGDDTDTLMQMADLALYRAKDLGRNRVERYETGMMEKAVARRRTESDLMCAVKNGELELHYQPLRGLPDLRLKGFEALLRWNHPGRGRVSPAEFIPLAEETGAIVEIGAWVLDEACRQVALWPDNLQVAVNISAVQMRSPGLVDLVRTVLERHGIAPHRLELELTETALVEDGASIAATLTALRRLGVRIAMDDFGTGYSSLKHLRDFELDRIKIDRSFVSTAIEDAGSSAVVRAVTGMASDLSITATGEGVETAEQLARLVELGCEAAQGYLLGKPMSGDEATALTEAQPAGNVFDLRRSLRT